MSELTQESLVEEMRTLGVGRYRAKNESAKARSSETETNYGQRLMRGALPELKKGVDQWKKSLKSNNKARYQIDCLDLPSEIISFISVKSVLDSISKKAPLVQVAHYLGARIEDELRCRFLLEHNKDKGEGIILGARRRKGVHRRTRHVRNSMKHEATKGEMPTWDKWGKRDKLNMGLVMVELIRVHTTIIEYIYILEKRGKKPVRYVSCTKEAMQWIEDYNSDREFIEPFWLPTVELPKPWKSVWEGGYDSENHYLPELPFIKTNNMDYLRGIEGNLPVPMEAANLIQQTPFTINQDVYKVMGRAWEENLCIGDLPNREDDTFPPIPIDFKTDPDVNRSWRRQAAKIFASNLSQKSQRLLTVKILHLAEKFLGNRFFFPAQCDFRGRIYTVPSFLTPQGISTAKALLQFNRPMKIKNDEQAKWLAIQGANTFGNDKVTLEEREFWAHDFSDEAVKIAENPWQHTSWQDADDPWGFIAWCFEWAKYKTTSNFETYLPCSMDATNNGLQLLSLLARDPEGAFATNVANTEVPQDVYGMVSALVKKKLELDAADGNEWAKGWLTCNITRSLAKRPTMVYPYGGTFYSCRQYVDDWYQDLVKTKTITNPFTEDDRYKCTGYLAGLTWQAINEVLDAPKHVMNWLREIAYTLAKAQRTITWTTPSGFPVTQAYPCFKSNKVETKIGGTATHVKWLQETDKLSAFKAKNGMSPNFVHSLDASLLMNVVAACGREGIFDYCMIHDSYATHSPNAQKMADIIRKETFTMFSVDRLSELHLHLVKSNPDIDLPPPPSLGDFDISEVLKSKYFFS
nr:Mitochondrial DNA-directed RNA polymerase (RPO41) [uncultured Mediterranean phage uvMED]